VGGGIGIAISWFLGITYLYKINQIDNNLYFAFLCGIPLSIVGLFDDLYNLNIWIRLSIHFFSACFGLYFLSGLRILEFGFITISSSWLLIPISVIAIVWLINLFNFLDGIDGYISTEVIFIGLSIFFLFNDSIGLLLAVVTLGFLFWNWQKAKIFMGDVSSTLLGYNVAIIAIYYQNQKKASIIIWLILTSVFWFDATVTLARRIRNHENLGLAHRKHAFQRIVQAGFSHQKTVLWALLLNIIGLGFVFLSLSFPELSTFFLFLDIGLLFVVLKYVDKKKPFEYNYHIDS
jgi:UDP-N-acetylmuramyl pentapeptide phosphotransferase/UDP-N-acetylglucosamine-1-phosphate transferase